MRRRGREGGNGPWRKEKSSYKKRVGTAAESDAGVGEEEGIHLSIHFINAGNHESGQTWPLMLLYF